MTPLERTIEKGKEYLASVLEDHPNLDDDQIDEVIDEISHELTPTSISSLIEIATTNSRLFCKKVNGNSVFDLLYQAMIDEIKEELTNEVFVEED